MSTTRATARTRLLQALGFPHLVGRTPSTAGAGGGTTTVDTTLGSVYFGDDYFNGWWEIVPLGPAGVTSYAAKQISDFAGGDGAGTLTHAAFAAQVTTAATYELSPYDPALLHTALNASARRRFPDLAIPMRNESLMVDNLLSNGGFDTYSSGFTGWTEIGTPTVTQETSRKAHGASSAKIVASGATEGLEQNIFTSINVRRMTDRTLHVRAWIFATVADAARIRVTFDGTTYTNGSWHGGDAEWEDDTYQYIDVTIPDDATECTISCEVTDGNTAYFDLVRAWVDPVYRYTIPSTIIHGPYNLTISRRRSEPDGLYGDVSGAKFLEDSSGRYIMLDRALPPGHILRLDGFGLLSTLSTDTGTVELDDPKVDLWVAEAGLWLAERYFIPANPNETQEKTVARLQGEIQYLVARPGMTFRRPIVRRYGPPVGN